MKIRFKPNQVCRWNPANGFELDGKPVYIVGTNYVPHYACTNFWEDWRPDIIAADLNKIAGLGLNGVRIPIHWEYTEPAPGRFREEALARMEKFYEMAQARGIFVMPWFLVGVATMDYDVVWREGRSFFTEPMLSREANHLRTLVRRLKHFPNALCWDICDEPEWYSRKQGAEQLPYKTDHFHHWVDCLYRAIKEVDPERAVTLGFGHISSGHYGMDIRRAARTLDVMSVTAYPAHAGEDLLNGYRSGYYPSWSTRFNDCAGKGVFTSEAPGWSDVDASPVNIGHYYRVALMSGLANGSMGILPWVWSDFDDELQHLPPIDIHPRELSFGIVHADGSLKPAAGEMKKFAGFIAKYPPAEWRQIGPEVGVLGLPRQPEDAPLEFSHFFHHYILLRQAGLRVRYIWPDDLRELSAPALFFPCSDHIPLITGAWLRLKEWVSQGGVLVSTSNHTSPVFNQLFGVTLEGSFKPAEDTVFTGCREICADCEGLRLPQGLNYLLVTPERARALARDAHGRPLVTQAAVGKGQAIFIAYPPEAALSSLGPEALGKLSLHRLFRAAAALAGLKAPVTCSDPRLELDVRRHADGRLLAIAINHSRFPVKTALRHEADGREIPVELTGNGVHWEVIEAARAGAPKPVKSGPKSKNIDKAGRPRKAPAMFFQTRSNASCRRKRVDVLRRWPNSPRIS